LAVAVAIAGSLSAAAQGGEATAGAEAPGFPLPKHLDQFALSGVPAGEIIHSGSKLFSANYNKLDGVGANLSGDPAVTVRFTRFPRMDLPGFAGNPNRPTGPNSQSCVACHDVPFAGAAGALADNEIRDSLRTGDPTKFVQRNPIALSGSGALQLLAEQTTTELKAIRAAAVAKAASTGQSQSAELVTSNGIDYGQIRVSATGQVDTSAVQGMDPDLILKPYTWKGAFVTFLRPLVSTGTDNEMGLQPTEFVGENTDFDGDGVTNEMSVGDISAMTLYLASLPRPVTQLELDEHLGGRYRLSQAERDSIRRGESQFAQVGCAACHRPTLVLKNPVFREPSPLPEHRYPGLPVGDPASIGLDPARPLAVNLALNPQIGNVPNDSNCRRRPDGDGDADDFRKHHCFLQYEMSGGSIIVRLYGDLKRHDMGSGLAENIDEAGTGRSVWKTRDLWGVGSTGPWLHDGRATTLDEAIVWHGGEAQSSKLAYESLSAQGQADLIRFLQNLVLFDSTRTDK
jgi:cytochrome c peroxidase